MSTLAAGQSISSVLQENRKFPPAPEFSAQAHFGSEEQYLALAAPAA